MDETKKEAAYSIKYAKEGEERAIDWGWFRKERWTHSDKEYGSPQWFPTEKLDEEAYEKLLEHFGLLSWQSEFPLEKVITMSPAQLAAARRAKEREKGLEKKEMVSDTLGNHHLAEEYA